MIATTSRSEKKTVMIDLTKSPPNLPLSKGGFPLSPPHSPSGSMGGKMKTKRHSSHYSNKKNKDNVEQALPPSYLVNPVQLSLPSSMTSIPLPQVASPIKVN